MAYNVPAYAMFLPASILFYQKKRAKIWVRASRAPNRIRCVKRPEWSVAERERSVARSVAE